MQFLKLFTVVLLVAACSADFSLEELGKLIELCGLEDSDCLKRSVQNFLEKTHAGVPAYDIRPIDPITFDTLTFPLSVDKRIDHTLSNCTVTGYKNQRVNDYIVKQAEKVVQFKTTADLVFDCRLSASFIEENVVVDVGNEKLTATVTLAATFGYDTHSVDGVDHFVVKEEEVCCIPANDVKPTFVVEPGALEKFHEHPSIVPKKEYVLENSEMYIKKCMCAVARHTFPTVVHNIRALTRALPATAFTNLKNEYHNQCDVVTEQGIRKLADRKLTWRWPNCKSGLIPIGSPATGTTATSGFTLDNLMEEIGKPNKKLIWNVEYLVQDVRSIKSNLQEKESPKHYLNKFSVSKQG